jgi:CDP-paratose 2-epimerase
MPTKYLITGGAGFIGCNYAARLLKRGDYVTIYDNLSRSGTPKNIQWLIDSFGTKKLKFIQDDIRNFPSLAEAAKGQEVIVHLAGQVAVTNSVVDPRTDFEINALGTFNVLESARENREKPFVIYASTNKVYGEMTDIKIQETEKAYAYADFPYGIKETHPLDFHSPYGCSKGAGDQYVRDYARIYGLPTVVMRQSCIYGPRQFGIEDQGWVAWFIIAALTGQPITIYGNGKQVRDVLFINDLLDAYDAAVNQRQSIAGEVYNIGGGHKNTISIWVEFSKFLNDFIGESIKIKYEDFRPGDQLIYVSDIRKAQSELGWSPRVDIRQGFDTLFKWVSENINLITGG